VTCQKTKLESKEKVMKRNNRLCLHRVEDTRAKRMQKTCKSISTVTRHGVVTVLSIRFEKSR